MSGTRLEDLLAPADTGVAPDPDGWVTLSPLSAPADEDREAGPVSARRVLGAIALGTLLVLAVVGVAGSLAASRLAERESVRDAAKSTSLLAEAVVQPVLTDGLRSGDPAAVAAMDRAVRAHVLGPSYVRVKIWTPEGRIVYSDARRLEGRTYPLGTEEREVLTRPTTRAEVSDLDRPENALERGRGKLLEVYRPVWSPDGSPLLFETYAPYDDVTSRAGQLWRGFATITVSSLLAMVLLVVPVVWHLLARVRRAQRQRERLLERAVDASSDERRRIAGTLHDGVVQELVAASFTVAGAAERARACGQPELADRLKDAAGTVRAGIGGMRSLLVDIYPPHLATSGLIAALEDLTPTVRARGVEVLLDLDPEAAVALDDRQGRLVHRIAHEALLNTTRHAAADHVVVRLRPEDRAVVLEVEDDGIGFAPEEMLSRPSDGHFGLRILGDVAADQGAELQLSSAPGRGTRWRLLLPEGPTAAS
ncbi:MAG: ATP-binding protein [Nocardioidaceae bacterium]